MAESDCPRLGKLIGGCKFVARYSLPAYQPPGEVQTTADAFIRAVEVMRPRVYEGDVCVRCGRRVEKKPTGSDHG